MPITGPSNSPTRDLARRFPASLFELRRGRPPARSDVARSLPLARESLFPQPADISCWRTPEEPGVLSAELRRTQIADAAARLARVQPLKQHQPPGFVQ